MENEIWKPITMPIDLTGRLEISSEGQIKRLGYFTKGKKWKPDLIFKLSKAGRYIKISVKKDKVTYNLSVHRLVCYAFHPNPENRPQVNHKNGIKHDNRACNVEWATQSENIRHAQSIGLMKYAKPKPPKRKPGKQKGTPGIFKKVINIDTNEVFESAAQVCNATGIKFRSLRRALSGERYNRTPYRYFVKGEIKNDVMLPPPPKIKIEKPKFVRPPKREYIPHPLPTKNVIMSDLSGNQLNIFPSSREAASHINTKVDTFRKWLRSTNTGFHKGFIFRYA